VFTGIFGDVQGGKWAVVGSARRDEVDVDDGAGGPGVALVDGIAVAIDLERFVEVAPPGFNGAFAVVFDFAAPEKWSGPFSSVAWSSSQTSKAVDGAAGEEVADFAGAYDDVYQDIVAAGGRLRPRGRGGRVMGTRFASRAARR